MKRFKLFDRLKCSPKIWQRSLFYLATVGLIIPINLRIVNVVKAENNSNSVSEETAEDSKVTIPREFNQLPKQERIRILSELSPESKRHLISRTPEVYLNLSARERKALSGAFPEISSEAERQGDLLLAIILGSSIFIIITAVASSNSKNSNSICHTYSRRANKKNSSPNGGPGFFGGGCGGNGSGGGCG